MDMKQFLHRAFSQEKSKLFHRVNNFFAALTIVSILSLVLETVPNLSQYSRLFLIVEWFAVLLFALEYIGRTIVSKPGWKYTFSFFGIVDLVAILPTFLGLGNFVFLKSARALRIIRLLRMLRLAKVSRSGLIDEKNMSVMSLNIIIYFATLTFALLITGTVMYLVEPQLAAFSSIPAGMWWSFKVFLASIPVTQPVTVLGETFYVLTRFIGLMMLGLLVGVVGNVFRSLLMGKK
jgi:voltage-gated potassium channel